MAKEAGVTHGSSMHGGYRHGLISWLFHLVTVFGNASTGISAPPRIATAVAISAAALSLLFSFVPLTVQAQAAGPAAPTDFIAFQLGPTAVGLHWNNPGDSSITGYAYSQDGGSTWTDIVGRADTTGYVVGSLTVGEIYDFQVRAEYASSVGSPSDTVRLAVAAAAPDGRRTACSGSTAVPHATNWGLINDCAWLLEIKDTLIGAATLSPDWSVDTAIGEWVGIDVAGSSARVATIDLSINRLTGVIPAELGNLTNLAYL